MWCGFRSRRHIWIVFSVYWCLSIHLSSCMFIYLVMSIYSSICQSICISLFTFLLIYLSFNHFFIILFIYIFMYLSTYFYISQVTPLSIYQFLYLFIYHTFLLSTNYHFIFISLAFITYLSTYLPIHKSTTLFFSSLISHYLYLLISLSIHLLTTHIHSKFSHISIYLHQLRHIPHNWHLQGRLYSYVGHFLILNIFWQVYNVFETDIYIPFLHVLESFSFFLRIYYW